jgi:hypothetical protein
MSGIAYYYAGSLRIKPLQNEEMVPELYLGE